jgi:hypothetical protein
MTTVVCFIPTGLLLCIDGFLAIFGLDRVLVNYGANQVDTDFWNAWLLFNRDADYVLNQLIFAA